MKGCSPLCDVIVMKTLFIVWFRIMECISLAVWRLDAGLFLYCDRFPDKTSSQVSTVHRVRRIGI